MTQFGIRPTMRSVAAQRINAAGRMAQWEMIRTAREAAKKAAEDLERAKLERDAARKAAFAELVRRETAALLAAQPETDLTPKVTVREVTDAVCEHFHVSRVDIVSSRRALDIVRPRQIAVFLCKEFTRRSLPELGRFFGDRDHTTMLHAIRRVAALIAAGAPIANDVEAIRGMLR